MKKLSWIISGSLALALTASLTMNCIQHDKIKKFEESVMESYRKLTCGYSKAVSKMPYTTVEKEDFTDSLGELSKEIRSLGKVLEEYR